MRRRQIMLRAGFDFIFLGVINEGVVYRIKNA